MDKSFKKNLTYLFLYFTLTLLICFTVQIFCFESGALQNYKSDQMIFGTIWILIIFTIIFFILKKAGIDPKIFFVHCIIFGPFIFLGGVIFSVFIGPNNINIINQNYVGTSGVTESENANGDGINTHYHNTYVFHKKNKSLSKELDKLEEEFSEGSSKDEFIFWQTALAQGFEPKYIREYNCCEDFSQRLELYLTVGPLTIVECLIKATTQAFSLLILPLIGLLFKKRLFFDDIEGLRKIYKQVQSNDD
jgi:hypothetical protein